MKTRVYLFIYYPITLKIIIWARKHIYLVVSFCVGYLILIYIIWAENWLQSCLVKAYLFTFIDSESDVVI